MVNTDSTNMSNTTNITTTAMTAYISFSIPYFIMCLFYESSVFYYILGFLIYTFVIQLSMNIWASTKVCQVDDTKTPNLYKAFGYTVIPWILIVFVTSFILYVMPGWVRIFSNTIGLAVAQSVYNNLFTIPKPADDDGINSLINDIYHDPSKIINEIGYLPTFKEWYENIYSYLRTIPYFNNEAFNFPGSPETIDTNHLLYQLYKCVSIKEKIGYFIWMFLIGAIFVLVSLSQMYESDC